MFIANLVWPHGRYTLNICRFHNWRCSRVESWSICQWCRKNQLVVCVECKGIRGILNSMAFKVTSNLENLSGKWYGNEIMYLISNINHGDGKVKCVCIETKLRGKIFGQLYIYGMDKTMIC